MDTVSRDINYFKFGQGIEMKKEKLLIKVFVSKFRHAIECLLCEILSVCMCGCLQKKKTLF